MRHLSMISLAAALAATAACADRNDESVVTKTDAGTVASPSDSAADANGVSLVRVVNAAPGSGTVTVRAGDEAPFTSVAYKTVTPYREVRGNMVRFRVLGSNANDSTDLAANNEVMTDGNRYTIFIIPDDDANDADNAGTADARKVSMKVVRDELETDSSRAQIRFINAAAAAGELDLTMAGRDEPIFDDVNFGNEAGFESIAPATRGQLVIRREEGNRTLASVRDIRSLQAGKLYTVIVTGRQGKWDVITFEDAMRDMMTRTTNANAAGGANPR